MITLRLTFTVPQVVVDTTNHRLREVTDHHHRQSLIDTIMRHDQVIMNPIHVRTTDLLKSQATFMAVAVEAAVDIDLRLINHVRRTPVQGRITTDSLCQVVVTIISIAVIQVMVPPNHQLPTTFRI